MNTYTIYELPPMLNGKNGLKRMHWASYRKIRDKWCWFIKASQPEKITGQAQIHFIRYSTRQPDWDNLYASFKVIGDALVSAGVIKDDSPDVVTKLTAEWKKVSKRKYQRTEIQIEHV